MPKDLSGFINRICAEFPDQVVTVRRPIRASEYEVTAVLQHLDNAGQYPMALFEQPINMLGEAAEFPINQRKKVAHCLRVAPTDLEEELSDR